MVHHGKYLTLAPFRLGLSLLPVKSQLGVGLNSRPGSAGSQFEYSMASSKPTVDAR